MKKGTPVIFRGRSEDVMKIRGKLVSRTELEAQLLEIPEIRNVFTTQILTQGTETVLIFAETDLTPNSLELLIFRRIPYLRKGITVICLLDLPRTSLGKIDKHQLLNLQSSERKGVL